MPAPIPRAHLTPPPGPTQPHACWPGPRGHLPALGSPCTPLPTWRAREGPGRGRGPHTGKEDRATKAAASRACVARSLPSMLCLPRSKLGAALLTSRVCLPPACPGLSEGLARPSRTCDWAPSLRGEALSVAPHHHPECATGPKLPRTEHGRSPSAAFPVCKNCTELQCTEVKAPWSLESSFPHTLAA